MNWLHRFAMATVISLMIAFGLSLLSDRQLAQNDSMLAASKVQERIVLADDNLVDHLSRLTLNQDLHKADWRHSILLLDLSVDPQHHSHDDVFSDLHHICEFAFQQTSNIKEVLVRVIVKKNVLPNQARDVLLLSLDASRDQWERVENAKGTLDAETRRLAMDVYFRMVYTEAWYELMDNKAI